MLLDDIVARQSIKDRIKGRAFDLITKPSWYTAGDWNLGDRDGG